MGKADQNAHDVSENFTAIAREDVEHQLAGFFVRPGGDGIGLDGADRDPRGKEIEYCDGYHRGIGRNRDRGVLDRALSSP